MKNLLSIVTIYVAAMCASIGFAQEASFIPVEVGVRNGWCLSWGCGQRNPEDLLAGLANEAHNRPELAALWGLPADVLSAYFKASQANDEFSKRDLQPRYLELVQGRIKDAMAVPAYVWHGGPAMVNSSAYDFQHQAYRTFASRPFAHALRIEGSSHTIEFSNEEEFTLLPLSEEKARNSLSRPVLARYEVIFAPVVSTRNSDIAGRILRMRLLLADGSVLAEKSAEAKQ